MRIAVTSQNFKTITGHAGKARRFLVYETDASGTPPQEIDRLDLPQELSVHAYHGEDHPLFGLGLQALVTQGAGQGFIERLARHGILVHATSQTDPLVAVVQVATGQPLAAALPHDHDHHHAESQVLVQLQEP